MPLRPAGSSQPPQPLFPAEPLLDHDVDPRLGLVLAGALSPSLFEPLLDGRLVDALLVGLAASLAEPARIAAGPVHDLPAEVERLAHDSAN